MRGETSAIRFSEAQKLLDYGFSNFEYVKYSNKGDTLQNIPVDKGITDNVNIIFEQDAGSLIPKGKASNITTKLQLPEKLMAPVEKGQKIGEVTFLLGEETLNSINLIANDTVKKINVGNMLVHVFENWLTLLRI